MATITVAEADDVLVGFVTVDPTSFDLDQIVVAPEAQGEGVAAALIAEAKRISPGGLDLQHRQRAGHSLLREGGFRHFRRSARLAVERRSTR